MHDQPDEDRIEDARVFLRQFKLLLKGGEAPTPKDFAEVIAKVDDPLTSKVVQTALLRSMKQARYDVENTGHFALDFDSYTHFTSPIRRYPDLIVHRQIQRLLQDPDRVDSDETHQQILQSAEQTSMAERRAESATRGAIQWLKCEFMSHKIGDRFTGIVTSVTDFGLFVELKEFYVDGLVHITSLGQDYYKFNPDLRQLIGENSGRIYKTGDSLEIQVSRVDMEQGRIDFALTEVKDEKFNPKKRSRKPSGSLGGKPKNQKSYAHKSGKASSSRHKRK